MKIDEKIDLYLGEEKGVVNAQALSLLINMFDKVKNQRELEILYNELSKPNTRAGKLFKECDDQMKETFMDYIKDLEEDLAEEE